MSTSSFVFGSAEERSRGVPLRCGEAARSCKRVGPGSDAGKHKEVLIVRVVTASAD